MSVAPLNTPSAKHPVANSVGGQAVQTIQGWYYVIGGLSVALVIQMFQSETAPHYDLSRMWAIRAIGLLVAVFGAALVASGRRKEAPFIGGGAAMCVAFLLGVLGAVLFGTGVLPPLFLIDAGVEIGFAGWWAAAVLFWFAGVDRPDAMTAPPTPPTNG